jgi:glycosyltransferase involved in cell wall biosynthesis
MNNKNISENHLTVLMVNSDLSSKGGIASVIRTLYEENKLHSYPINIILLKTSHYMNKSMIFEFFLLASSFSKYLFLISSKKIDIVHIHSSAHISFYRKSLFFIFGKFFGKKVVFHLHSSDFYEFFLTTNPIKSSMIGFVFQKSDLVITLCRDWKQKLLNRYSDLNVKTIHNPISVHKHVRKEHFNPSEKMQVLFLGFLISSKGIQDILKLGLLLKKNNVNNIRIVIAGKGKLESWLKKNISTNGLNDILEFVGWVENREKLKLLNRSMVYFLPSYKEGMPISILEAMCHSMAIVSTRVAGIPDLVTGGLNGELAEPGDINAFYKILTTFADNPQKVEEMGQESCRLVRNFDSSRIWPRIIDSYKELIQH